MLNTRMKVAGKWEKNNNKQTKKKTSKPNKSDPNNTTTTVQKSWSNLKDTPGSMMEFNTASKEKCKEKEMTNVISKFKG